MLSYSTFTRAQIQWMWVLGDALEACSNRQTQDPNFPRRLRIRRLNRVPLQETRDLASSSSLPDSGRYRLSSNALETRESRQVEARTQLSHHRSSRAACVIGFQIFEAHSYYHHESGDA